MSLYKPCRPNMFHVHAPRSKKRVTKPSKRASSHMGISKSRGPCYMDPNTIPLTIDPRNKELQYAFKVSRVEAIKRSVAWTVFCNFLMKRISVTLSSPNHVAAMGL